jgi:hypothetical protein
MPSLQNSAGAGKAAKFVSGDPLGPMINPFDGLVRSNYHGFVFLKSENCGGFTYHVRFS